MERTYRVDPDDTRDLAFRRLPLAEAVYDHACENYERGGWDYVVECYDRSELAELVGRATTVHGAISNVAKATGIALHNARREEFRAWRVNEGGADPATIW